MSHVTGGAYLKVHGHTNWLQFELATYIWGGGGGNLYKGLLKGQPQIIATNSMILYALEELRDRTSHLH